MEASPKVTGNLTTGCDEFMPEGLHYKPCSGELKGKGIDGDIHGVLLRCG